MAHFYISEELQGAAVGDTVTIAGPEARHAVTVSRVTAGDPIVVGNGSGLVVGGTVTATVGPGGVARASATPRPVHEPGARTPAMPLSTPRRRTDLPSDLHLCGTTRARRVSVPWYP